MAMYLPLKTSIFDFKMLVNFSPSHVFFFFNARPGKISPKNQEVREANFAKYFPPHPQHFAKFRSRSAFLHSASFAPKTLWRSAERSSALLLQQKHHASRGGASARGERYDTLF